MKKILVIEDDSYIRQEVVEWLQFENFEVISASNGHDGIALGLEHLPDLVICDIVMPRGDGYHVLLELRRHPSLMLVPMIFVTAKEERPDLHFAMAPGMEDYITKPFTREAILQAVHHHLEQEATLHDLMDTQGTGAGRALLYSLPHELGIPLISILSIGEILSEQAKTLQAKELAELGTMLTLSAQRLDRFIKNFLLYIQMTDYHGKQITPENEPLLTAQQVGSTIEDVCRYVASQYHRIEDLHMVMKPKPIRINLDRLRIIVYEIVDNAFKFSKLSQTVLIIGQAEGEVFILKITDLGRGISTQNLSQIGAFQQFDREAQEHRGLGLGLTIVRWLVEQSKGTLTIESIPNRGTTVRVELMTDLLR
ncbi:MAG: response regulator [Anaerolineae bacterium]